MAHQSPASTPDSEEAQIRSRTLDMLLLLKEQFDPQRVKEVCWDLIELAKNEAAAGILEDYHAHTPVLDMMEQHSYLPEIQEAGCNALATMMQVSDKLMDLVQKRNIHSEVLDIMAKHINDAKVQASAMKTIAFLAMSVDTCAAMLEEDVIGAILVAMKNFPQDAAVQKNACQALKQLLTDETDRQVEFVDKNKHRVVINAIHNHFENHAVLEDAFWLLAILAIPEECYDVLLQESHKTIIAAMKKFREDVGLQTASCALMEALAQTDDSQQLFVLNDASDLLIDALGRFGSNSRFITICLSLLDTLAEAIFTAPEWLDRVLNDNWIRETFLALTQHQDSPPCLEVALRALTTLVSNRPGILEELITEESECMAVDSAVLMSMRLHARNSTAIYENACDAIQAMAEKSETLQKSLAEKGAVYDIKMGMTTYSQKASCQAAASRAVRGLCMVSDDRDEEIAENNKLRVAESDVHSLLFLAMKQCMMDRDILIDIVKTVTCLADLDVVKHQCMVEGIHEIILYGMGEHQDDPFVQELFLETIVVLSAAEGMIDILCEAGILSMTVEIMEKYSHNEDIQEKGTIVLQTVVNRKKSICDHKLAEKIAKAIVSSMKKFRKVPSLLAESCVAMQFLADISHEVTKTLVNYNAHEELFHILEAYPEDETLVNLVCECLYVLCCKWEFTTQMLVWACKKNLMKSVDVLVQLCADVNVGEGNDTPMCYACQNNNIDMVKLLLRQGISDLHTPLSLSLQLGHHHITGLLLHQMGYDKEVGSVTWSSLGLAQLNPEWFYPVFLGEEPPSSPSPLNLSETDSGSSLLIASRIRQTKENRQRRRILHSRLTEEGNLTKMLKWTLSSAALPYPVSPGGPRPPPPSPIRRIQSAMDTMPSVIISEAGAMSLVEPRLLDRRDSEYEGSTSTLTPPQASTPVPSDTPMGASGYLSTSAVSDTDDDIMTDSAAPALLPQKQSKRSASVSSFFSSQEGFESSTESKGQRHNSLSDNMLRMSFLRRKSLSTAQLPILPDDPRWPRSIGLELSTDLSGSEPSLVSRRKSSTDRAPPSPVSKRLSTTSTGTTASTDTSSGFAPGDDSAAVQISFQSSETGPPERQDDRRLSGIPPARLTRIRREGVVVEPYGLSDSSTADDFSDAGTGPNMPDVLSQIGGPLPQRLYRNTPHRGTRRSISSAPMLDVPEGPDTPVKFLDMSANNISDLTPLAKASYRLTHEFRFLEKLDLSNNGLTEFPKQLTHYMPELRELNLRNNGISEMPLHLFSLSKLQMLDLSNNQIKDLKCRPEDSAFKLVELDLSHNAIVRFPSWLSMFVPSLQVLSFACNKIDTIPDKPLTLGKLKTLDLSNNRLTTLTPVFLHGCGALENLNASNNCLDSLPDELCNLLGKLSVLKVANNRLGLPEPPFVPKSVLQLPWLRNLDLSGNSIIEVPPPSEWKSQALREIILSHNRIKKITLGDNLRSWMKVERLIVSHNKLTKIPKELGQLSWLASLDISHNKSITTIPDEIGKLSKLWEFPLDGLKLDLDPAILRGRTKDIIGFLSQKLKRSVPYNRMKLMVVGYGGRGKSTLLAKLQRQKFDKKAENVATAGVEVKEWNFQLKTPKKMVDFCLSTWDFAGQEEFYSTHPCFLTGRALFLVVYDISKGPEEIKTLRPWLLTIQALAPYCPVIVVGTHKDKIHKEKEEDFISDMRMRVQDICRSPGFPVIKGYMEISCHTEQGGVDELRDMIGDVIMTEKIKGQPILGQMIPYSYLKLEELLQAEAKRLKSEGRPPVMVHRQVTKMVRENGLQLDEDELSQAVRFLHETGVLLHYDDPSQQLKNLYFIEPQWLCKIMARVITVREINPFISKAGIMKVKDVHMLFSDGDIPKRLMPQYLKLLERFEVSLPVSETELLLPCKVPTQKPNITLPVHDPKQDLLHRYYSMYYVPIGFWTRLVLSLVLFCKYMMHGFRGLAEGDTQPVFWREGIFICWSEEAFFLIEPLKKGSDTLKISVPKTKLGFRLLGLVCDHLDDLIEEWFPGLCDVDPMLGRPLVQRLVPCIMCETARPHLHPVCELMNQSEISDTINCPNHPHKKVLLQSLAPDVTLADLEDKFLIDMRHLNFIQRQENVLGEGSFGSVYKATYRDKPVAVKVFSKGGENHPHRLLRQEVTVLRHLQHPSLVSMEGVGLTPRILVMELAPMGSLNGLLHSGRIRNRSLQHRIAMQVAEGLAFLHKNRIVYRDLKPDNVLIFSLALGTLQNAKISDYGISRFATPYGLKSSEGTPGYRAPEVIRGTSNYNTEVDVYSFGILLYELVTDGRKPFEDLEFRTEIDEAVIKGQHLPHITQGGIFPWPDLQELIDHCTEHVPESRPTAAEAFNRLSSAEMLCLKQAFPLLSGVNVECQALRTYRYEEEERTEVWLAGGEKNSTLFSWFALHTTEQDAAVQGMVIQKGRALCMVAVGSSSMIVGTQSCELCVIDVTTCPYQVRHTVPQLPDAVLCLAWHSKKPKRDDGKVFAGLANGTIAEFNAKRLRTDKECKPDQIIQIGTVHEPVKCSCLTSSKLWVGVGDRVEALNLKTLRKEIRLEHDQAENTKDPRTCSLVKSIAVDKYLWLCRRNSSVIEVWDIAKRKMKMSIDLMELMREQFPDSKPSDFDIKSLLLQPHIALWVGTAAGQLVLIDINTNQLVTVISRHVSGLRSIMSVPKGFGVGKSESVIVTAGMGFVRRPGVPHHTETEYSYALVWDAEVRNQVRYLQSDADRRKKSNNGHNNGWHKVQIAVRTLRALRT